MTGQAKAIIKAKPHPGQVLVHNSTARFKVLASGRRWGKTHYGINECWDVASKGGRAWWIAPSYKMAEVGWRPLKAIAYQIGADVSKVDKRVGLDNGGEISVRSADNPDSLRGEGLNFAVMDECAFMQKSAWTESIRPALSDRQGSALFISTPKGRNWFWENYQLSNSKSDWQSWQFPTETNPFINKEEIAAAKDLLPERVFLQEYMAEFIDDAGGVFRNVMNCATARETGAVWGGQYIYGVDWGKHNDYTVITILDAKTRSMVDMDRFNRIDYAVQVNRLKAKTEVFPPLCIVVESNSMGEPLIEQLQRDGFPIYPFQTSNASKTNIIDALALAFERSDISILNDPVLISELQAYEMERLPSGVFRYNAPEGLHDDCVMSLALAWSQVGVAATNQEYAWIGEAR